MHELLAGLARPGPLRVTNLASGRAPELFDLLEGPDPPEVDATCIDLDALALSTAAKRSADLPPAALARFFAETDKVPLWVDSERLDRGGATFLRSGPFTVMAMMCGSLPFVYASPAGNKPLIFSGRLVKMAPLRLAETGRFFLATCYDFSRSIIGDELAETLGYPRRRRSHLLRMLRFGVGALEPLRRWMPWAQSLTGGTAAAISSPRLHALSAPGSRKHPRAPNFRSTTWRTASAIEAKCGGDMARRRTSPPRSRPIG
jgi:hypothetical protein